MAVGPGRAVHASRDELTRDAVERSTSFARRALRARSAFFWSFADEHAVLVSSAGDTGGFDADRPDKATLASAFGRKVLESAGPLARGVPSEDVSDEGWLGVAVRAAGGEARGVLMVADHAPRAFDADDLDLIDEVGASLAREMERAAETAEDVPLRTLVDLSDTLVRDATATRSATADQYLAAADHLASVAAQLRQLARGEGTPDMLEAAARRDCAPPTLSARGARILVADDLDLNRKLIADMLTIEGHEVDCVTDGAAAVRAVQAKAYDLVLMDMIMPEMDGIAATRAIRALPAPMCRVPIVALTANSFREQLASCLDAGMDATLTKPMSIDSLTRAVADWTRDRHAAA